MWLLFRPIRFSVAVLAIIFVGRAVAGDEQKVVSPQLSSVILEGLPRFESPQAVRFDPAKASGPGVESPIGPAPSFASVQLPAFDVTALKDFPREEDVLTLKGQAEADMDEYLGDRHGLDRGVLNRYTLPELWRKIPVLGVLPFAGTQKSISNADRAKPMRLQATLKEMKELSALGESPLKGQPGDP